MGELLNNHNGDIAPILTMSNILFFSQKVNKVDRLNLQPLIQIVSDKPKCPGHDRRGPCGRYETSSTI